MTEHPIYAGDMSVNWITRPCAAQSAEGACEDAALKIGVDPQSTWTQPSSGTYGWVCSAHENVMIQKYQPERVAATNAQVSAEGREFWETYGVEAGETRYVSRQAQELNSLNSDTE